MPSDADGKKRTIFEWLKRVWFISIYSLIERWITFKRAYRRSRARQIYCFLTRNYSFSSFDPYESRRNITFLLEHSRFDFFDCTFSGRLYLLEGRVQRFLFHLKDILLWGSFSRKLQRVVYYSFVAFSLERNNSLNRGVLEEVVRRKKGIVFLLLDRYLRLNGKRWERELVYEQIDIFERNSIVQERIIRGMQRAVAKAKESEDVLSAKRGLDRGLSPLLVIYGSSGTYVMRGENREKVGIFKPFDEEFFAPNNPVGESSQDSLGRRQLRPTVRSGEMVHREVAASLIDTLFSFHLVPKTTYATFSHSIFFTANAPFSEAVKAKMGSFQKYIGQAHSLLEMPSKEAFSRMNVEELYRLILLDLILGNSDRNLGNILLTEENHLIAIDHGLCLPDRNLFLSYWYWARIEQLKTPLPLWMLEFLDSFPYDKVEGLLHTRCSIDRESADRIRERIVLFSEAMREGLLCEKIGLLLMNDELMAQLYGLKSTLKAKARELIAEYKNSLLEGPNDVNEK